MAKNNDNIVMTASEEASRKKGHNILPKVVSVIIAFVLWFYVMAVESPINEKTFEGIPINVILPAGSELTLYSGFNTLVDVTVSGKKSELNQLSAEDFTASADASQCTKADKYSIPVQITAPSGARVVDKSISVLSVYLDAKASAKVPVTVKFKGLNLTGGLERASDSEIIKSKNEITLYGPKSELDKIVAAQVTIDCSGQNITSTIRSFGNEFVLLNAEDGVVSNPYITTDVSTVDVNVPIYTTKEIDLKVDFANGLLDSSNCTVKLEPSKIKVKGTADVLNSLDEYVISTVDEKTLTSNKLNVTLSLPEGVSAVESVETVDVEITHKGTDTKTLSFTDINVNNPKELDYELSPINITFRGESDLITKLKSSDVTLSVDLSEQSKGTSVTLPINVKLSGTYSKSVYEIDGYTVLVTIK